MHASYSVIVYNNLKSSLHVEDLWSLDKLPLWDNQALELISVPPRVVTGAIVPNSIKRTPAIDAHEAQRGKGTATH